MKATLIPTDSIVTGDRIVWLETVFDGPYGEARPVGDRLIHAEVIRDSYGADKQQHTFTLRVLNTKGDAPLAAGAELRRKGRNLYRGLRGRERWADEKARQRAAAEKHARGAEARQAKRRRQEMDRGWEPHP